MGVVLHRGADYATRTPDLLALAQVPEPAALLLLGVGLLVVTHGRRRRVER